jgi:protein-tyrosine phosphatase
VERIVPLEKIRNLRDLGGLPTGDGRRVAPRRLFRAGSLYEMNESDRTALEGLGVRIVIDLRSLFEQERQSYRWPAGRKVAAPLARDQEVATIFGRFQAGTLAEEDMKDWWRLTRVLDIPEEHADSLSEIFRTLLQAGPDEGVLYHCSGGKDRTGVVSALVLEALGVTRAAIMDDFLLTNVGAADRAAEFIEWIRRATGRVMSPEAAYWLAAVKEEWLETFFHSLADRYGSPLGYLRERLGVGPGEIEALRTRYLEPAAG